MAENKRKKAIEAVKECATKLQGALEQSPKSAGAPPPLPTPAGDPEAVSEFTSGLSESWTSKYASQEEDKIKTNVANMRKNMIELTELIDATYASHKEPDVPEDSDDAMDKWDW
jgi:hypothetical protein